MPSALLRLGLGICLPARGYTGPADRCTHTHVWISSKASTALHKDTNDNLACVVLGHKVFSLFPPHDHAALYYTPIPTADGGSAFNA